MVLSFIFGVFIGLAIAVVLTRDDESSQDVALVSLFVLAVFVSSAVTKEIVKKDNIDTVTEEQTID